MASLGANLCLLHLGGQNAGRGVSVVRQVSSPKRAKLSLVPMPRVDRKSRNATIPLFAWELSINLCTFTFFYLSHICIFKIVLKS